MGLLLSLFVVLHLSCYSSLAMLVLRLKYLSVVFYFHIVGRNEALTEHILHWNKQKVLKLSKSLSKASIVSSSSCSFSALILV